VNVTVNDVRKYRRRYNRFLSLRIFIFALFQFDYDRANGITPHNFS
jgi:hypothetical protein